MKTSLNKTNSLSIFLVFSWALFLFTSCKDTQTAKTNKTVSSYVHLNGGTMGTSYHISYLDESNRNLKTQIDSVLVALNMEVSTYIPTATISQLNQSDKGVCLVSSKSSRKPSGKHFKNIFESSVKVHKMTMGAFDPTIMPLVNYWGFGYKGHQAQKNIDPDSISHILNTMGMDKFKLKKGSKSSPCNYFLHKSTAKAELDFSAIAKGYGVDIVAQLLENEGINNYKVEIGGELACKGKNPKGLLWKIGINTPNPAAGLAEFEAIVSIDNQAMASSGNYRNFREIDGKKYGHELNPKTGYSAKTDLLSVSVIADNCTEADAYATAFMVMGLDASRKMVEADPALEAYFISSDDEGKYVTSSTAGFESQIIPMQ